MKGTLFSAELPFVGRDDAQSRFRQLLSTDLYARSKQIIVISGPGGYGKSWLANKLCQIAQDEFAVAVVAVDWTDHATSIHTVAEVMDVLATKISEQLNITFGRYVALRELDLGLEAFKEFMRAEYLTFQDQESEESLNFDEYLNEHLTDVQKALSQRHTRTLSEAFVADICESLPTLGQVLIYFDNYESIDYHRHKGKQQNFADMWVQRLFVDSPDNVNFIICGRENHADMYEKLVGNISVNSFSMGQFSLVEVAKYSRAYLGDSVEALARQIFAFSNGVPFLVDLAVQLIKAFPNEPFESIFSSEQEGVEEADEILKIGATRFLQYLQKEKLLLLLACFISIVQLGGNRELQEELINWTLERSYPKSAIVVGLLERAAKSFSSVFPEPGAIRPEVRPIIVDALINGDINVNQAEFRTLLGHADEVLIDLITSEADINRYVYLLAQRINVTAWTDTTLSLGLLVRACSALSIHAFKSLQYLLDHVAQARLARVLPDVSRKHFASLVEDLSRSHLLAFLQSLPPRFIADPHLQCLLEVARLHLEIVIRSATASAVATLIKGDSIERKLSTLALQAENYQDDRAEYDVRAGLAETYLEYSKVLNKLRQFQKEAEVIERLIPLLETLPFPFRYQRLNYAYLRAARLAVIRNDFQLAVSLAERARGVAPDDKLTEAFQAMLPELMNNRAAMLLTRALDRIRQQSRVDVDSINELEEASRLAPGNANIYRNLIRVYRRDRKYEQALEASRALLELEPLNVSGMIGRGEVLYEMGAFVEAENTFKHALSVAQEIGEEEVLNVYTNLGRCCVMQQRYVEALEYFDKRIQGGLDKVGYYSTASASVQKLSSIQRNYLKHVFNRKAYVLLAIDRLDEARVFFQSVLELDDKYHEAWLGMAIIDGGQNIEGIAQGIKACRSNIAKNPSKTPSYFHLATLYLLSGTFSDSECESHFRKALLEAAEAKGFVFEAMFVLRLISRHASTSHLHLQPVQDLLGILESHVQSEGIDLPRPSNERADVHIFVSYSSQDRVSFVDRLADDLERQGYQVWVDNLDPRYGGIVGGYEWRQALSNAINSASVLMLVITPDSVQSDWVRAEVRLAGALNKPIVPLIVRPIDYGTLKGFHVAPGKSVADLHVRDFTGSQYRITLEKLLSDLRQYPQLLRGDQDTTS